jgi:hypothetical protein
MHFEKKRANWLNLAPQKKKEKRKKRRIKLVPPFNSNSGDENF